MSNEDPIQTSSDIHEAIVNVRPLVEPAEGSMSQLTDIALVRVLDIQFAMLGQLQLLTKAVLELEGEQCDGKPCLTIGTRRALQDFDE